MGKRKNNSKKGEGEKRGICSSGALSYRITIVTTGAAIDPKGEKERKDVDVGSAGKRVTWPV